MIPTPNLSHLTRKDYEHVYEPAEDTFLLLDALEADKDFLRRRNPRICLEIGSGSGCVSAFLGAVVGQNNSLYCCTDINPHASLATQATGQQNNMTIDATQASLASCFSQRCLGLVDILIFNPPYVPTEVEEFTLGQQQVDISGAWAGGNDGMNVTEHLLRQVKALLSPSGCFYLVAVSQNKPAEIMQRMEQEYGLLSKTVLSRRAGREHLHVLRFQVQE